jgi:soluble lytic murein transglycosylase
MNATAKAIVTNFNDAVSSQATKAGVPVRRVLAIIYTESRGQAGAIGEAQDIGLMQITPPALSDVNGFLGTAYSISDLLDPSINILVGCTFLGMLSRQFNGDIDKATRAYNVGASRVKKDQTAGMLYLASVKSKEAFF